MQLSKVAQDKLQYLQIAGYLSQHILWSGLRAWLTRKVGTIKPVVNGLNKVVETSWFNHVVSHSVLGPSHLQDNQRWPGYHSNLFPVQEVRDNNLQVMQIDNEMLTRQHRPPSKNTRTTISHQV